MAAHRSLLLAYVARLVDYDLPLAEDLVQETFLRAWLNHDGISHEPAALRTWLHRVAHNVAMDTHRRRRARPPEVELDPTHAPMSDPTINPNNYTTDDVLRTILVQQILQHVWPEHRAVLIEVYLHDHTATQTAHNLGLPVGTVKSRLHYALRHLRTTPACQALLTN